MVNNEEHIRLAQDFENLNIEELGNAEEQRKLRELEDLMLHASQCRSSTCQHPDCRNVKGVFRHAILCRTRATGGCRTCNYMWYLIKVHAQACKEESNCNVPRCRDMKEQLQQQSDSLRGVAEKCHCPVQIYTDKISVANEEQIRLAQDFENLNIEELGNAEEQCKLRELEDLMLHASQCRSSTCQHTDCRHVKGVFRHAILCQTRASGGCRICNYMWYLIKVHAQACKDESNCNVLRCRDMKERLQQQSDSVQGVAEVGRTS